MVKWPSAPVGKRPPKCRQLKSHTQIRYPRRSPEYHVHRRGERAIDQIVKPCRQSKPRYQRINAAPSGKAPHRLNHHEIVQLEAAVPDRDRERKRHRCGGGVAVLVDRDDHIVVRMPSLSANDSMMRGSPNAARNSRSRRR
jgi:hypothetical protein